MELKRKAIATLNTVGYKVFRVEFAPDESRLLTISDNPSRSLSYYAEWWDRDGTLLTRLEAPGVSSTSEVKFDVHGRYLPLCSGDVILTQNCASSRSWTVVAVVAGLTAETVFRKLLGVDVVRTQALAAQESTPSRTP